MTVVEEWVSAEVKLILLQLDLLGKMIPPMEAPDIATPMTNDRFARTVCSTRSQLAELESRSREATPTPNAFQLLQPAILQGIRSPTVVIEYTDCRHEHQAH